MGLFFMILTSIVMIALYAGAHFYVPWRLIRLFELSHAKLIYGGFAFAGVALIVSMARLSTSSNVVIQNFVRLTTIWAGIFVYGLLFLGLFDLINLAKKLPVVPSLIVVALLTLLVNAYGLWNGQQVHTVEQQIKLPGLKGDLSIVHISDLHLGNFRGRGYFDKVIDKVVALKPDMVVFNGDIIDGRSALSRSTFAPLKRLKCPIYFTAGNHDIYVGRKETEALLKELGVKVLKNEVVKLKGIQLIGLDYLRADDKTYDPHSTTKVTIEKTMPKIKLEQGIPSVAFHHSPIGVEYMEKAGVDLLVSGHTHGGQVFPFSLVARLQFKYNSGLYNYNKMKIYVSEGAGTYGPPLRVGTRNEISHLILKADD